MLASVLRLAPVARYGEIRNRHTPYDENLPTRTVVAPLTDGSVRPEAIPVPRRRPHRVGRMVGIAAFTPWLWRRGML
jgi:hypothetical protein